MTKNTADDRRKRLADIARELVLKEEISIRDLAKKHHVSERTIRDDVSAIQGTLVLSAGKGKLRFQTETYHDLARKTHLDLKVDVAAKTASYLRDILTPYPRIAMSPGTTVCLVAAALVAESYPTKFVTNSLAICDIPMPEESLTLAGGLFAWGPRAVVGHQTVSAFEENKAPVGILGVSGASAAGELFVNNSLECTAVEALIKSVSDLLIVVCDHSKLGKRDNWRVLDLSPDAEKRGSATAFLGRQGMPKQVVFVTNGDLTTTRQRSLGEADYKKQLDVRGELQLLEKSTAGRVKVVLASPDRAAYRKLRDIVPWMRGANGESPENGGGKE